MLFRSMLYIMDKTHKPVLEGKVGFMIKKEDNYNYVLAKRLKNGPEYAQPDRQT